MRYNNTVTLSAHVDIDIDVDDVFDELSVGQIFAYLVKHHREDLWDVIEHEFRSEIKEVAKEIAEEISEEKVSV